MNIETISVWAQLVASVGVIGSLFYLGAQVRQNTRSSRAVVVDSLAKSMHELAFAMAQNDQLLKIVTITLHNWSAATEIERARAASFLLGYFKLFENAWFQMRKGTLERGQWQGYDGFLRTVLGQPAVKPWWEMRRTFFAPGFREYVDKCEILADVPTLSDIVQTGK
ncbi:MAG: hypothetical protein QOI34_220 [Verrucomicrobiota bacterium]|jgi:hypothetical protein